MQKIKNTHEQKRFAHVERKSKETRIELDFSLDGNREISVRTGFPFADHMLELTAFWGGFDLSLFAEGDLQIDAHHTLEDIGLCFGQALYDALGERRGIARVGSAKVPMDEALTEVVLDLSGRAYLVYREDCLPAIIAGQEKDLWREFFKSFAAGAKMNLHISFFYGQNGHHLLESAFKGLGIALRQAVCVCSNSVPSTKGTLDL